MAPVPTNITRRSDNQHQENGIKSWSTGAIVIAAVLGFLFICLVLAVVAHLLRKRSQHKKLPPQNRRSSYHPFRAEQPDKSGLLANAAPSPEDDKSSMFSRKRGASVSLYIDTEVVDRRASMETVSLIPLHVTPAQEEEDPMPGNTSNGSGVSRGSRASLSVGEDLGFRPTRPRSTSSTSTRYYSTSPSQNTAPVQIPKIVHTPSD